MASVRSSISDFADLRGMLLTDHHLFHSIQCQMESEINKDKRQLIARRLIREIQHHFLALEEIVYPEIKSRLGEIGSRHVETETKLNERLKRELDELDEMDFNSQQFHAKVGVLLMDLKPHIKFEEEAILPELTNKLSISDNDRLVKEWRNVRERLMQADADIVDEEFDKERKQQGTQSLTYAKV